MKRVLIGALCALLLASPVSAHHVTVAESASDVDAFALYLSEYTAQHDPVVEMYSLYKAAESGPEKSDAGLALATGIETTIVHLESLDLRECFAPFHELALAEFDAVADHLAQAGANPTLSMLTIGYAGSIVQQIEAEIAPTLVECAT